MDKTSVLTSGPTAIPESVAAEPHEHAGWIERRLCVPGDIEETRHRKVQFTIASILVVPAGLLWGAVYFASGERADAAIPVAYSVLTLAHILLLFRLCRFELFRWTQQLLIFVLPFAMQLALGGFVGSSLVILWSFIAVLMSLLFGGAREARWWLAAYGASEGLRTVLVEQSAPGGRAGTTSKIENYLGFPSGVSGADLARRAATQARRFGAEVLAQETVVLRREDPYRIVRLADETEISCYAVLLATGVHVLQVEHGSLYPALHRLERKGWVASKWEAAMDRNREFKYYWLTPAGRTQLAREESKWKQLAGAISRVMGPAEES